jgi:hypothetical protein
MATTVRASIAVAKVGAALAVLTTALAFGVVNLGAPPIPPDHAVVTPAPHPHTPHARGSLPVLQLPIVTG